jgi:hypothetical protein
LYLKNQSNIIIENLDEMEFLLKNNDYKGLERSYNNLEETWMETKNIMFVFSNHKELDSIYESFLKIKVRISKKDYYGILEEIQIAKHLAKETPMKEIPTPANVF